MNPAPISTAANLEHVDCPVCGPATYTIWMNDGKPTGYVRCRTCRTVYATPRVPREIRYAWLDCIFGLGSNAIKNAESRRSALAQEAAIIRRYVTSGTMLDIGCDIGTFFEWFPSTSWQRFGVELSPSAAAYAAQTYTAQVSVGTIHQADFPTSFFDLVTMIDMLYYVDNPRASLQEVARILKPGSLLAIEFPGQAYQLWRSRGPVCLLLDRRWTRLHTDSSYLFWVNPKGLQRLLEDCGFTIIESHVIASPTGPSFWRRGAVASYRAFITAVSRFSRRMLTWAPKYLILAQCICKPRVS